MFGLVLGRDEFIDDSIAVACVLLNRLNMMEAAISGGQLWNTYKVVLHRFIQFRYSLCMGKHGS